MAIYIDPLEFLPIGTIEILRSKGFWDKPDDNEWDELITELEQGAVADITASVNFSRIEEVIIISELVKNHVAYDLFIGLNHNEQYINQAENYILRYDNLINRIKTSQDQSDIRAEEDFLCIPAIIIGKKGG